MATYTLRPNIDKLAVAWTHTGGDDFHDDIDEEHSQPGDAGDAALCQSTTSLAQLIVGVDDTPGVPLTATQIVIWIRGLTDGGASGDIYASYRIGDAGSLATWTDTNNTHTGAEAWLSVTFAGLTLTRQNLDDLQIATRSVLTGEGSTVSVDVMYAVVTYTLDVLDQTDIVSGVITQRQRDFAIAEFTLAEDTEIGFDSPIQITGNYTTEGATSSEIIFDGIIDEYNYDKQKKCTATSKQDEVTRLKPSGYYQGLTGIWLSDMVNDHADFLNFDSGDYGGTWTSYWDAPYNFSAQTGRTGEDIDFVHYISGISASITPEVDDGQAETGSVHKNVLALPMNSVTDYMEYDFDIEHSTGTVELWFYETDRRFGISIDIRSGSSSVCRLYVSTNLYYYNNTLATDSGTAITDSRWYRLKIVWNGDDTWSWYLYSADDPEAVDDSAVNTGTYTDGVNPDKIVFKQAISGTNAISLDAIGESWDSGYTVGDNASEIVYNLPLGSVLAIKPAAASQTLQQYLNEGCVSEKDTWALAPEGDVRMHDGTEDSEASYTTDAAEYWNCSGSIQAKRPNKAIVKGMPPLVATYEDTDRSTGAGVIVLKDFVPTINNQTALDAYAKALLETNQDPPLVVEVSLRDATQGFIQPGELVTVEASKWLWNDAGDYVTAGTYTIHEIRYHIKDGAYDYTEFILYSVLQFTEIDEPSDDDRQDQNTAGLDAGVAGTTVTGGSSGITAVVQDSSPQLGGDLDLNGSNIDFPTTANISDCIDDDAFGATATATVLATAESIKAYADTKATAAEAHAHVEANALTLEQNLSFAGAQTVDGRDISADINQAVKTTDSPTFVGLTLSADIVTSSTVDGQDIAAMAADLANQATAAEAHAYVEANALTLTAALQPQDVNLVSPYGVTFNADPADDGYSGNIMLIDTTGCNAGDCVYIDGNNSVAIADATDDTKMPVIGIVVAAGRVLTHGTYCNDGDYAFTAGQVIYMTTGAGVPDNTAPAGDGNIVQVLGIATEVDTIFLNPSLDWVEVVV